MFIAGRNAFGYLLRTITELQTLQTAEYTSKKFHKYLKT